MKKPRDPEKIITGDYSSSQSDSSFSESRSESTLSATSSYSEVEKGKGSNLK